MQKPFQIAGIEVKPGTRESVELPVGILYTHTELTMPVHVVHGRSEGPCLFVCAAIHGDEINGVEIIQRLIKQTSLKRLAGTLLAIPVVNVHGFLSRSRYLPDRRDLNRTFPGSPSGSLTARLAHIFMKEIVARSTYGIDLHTGSNYRDNLPQVRAQLDDPETSRIARAFGAPVLLDSALRPGSLREAAEAEDATVIVYEGGEALRFDELSVRVGVRGIMAVMREVGMLPPAKSAQSRTSKKHFSRSSTWMRAPQSGIVKLLKKLGDSVREGDQVAVVTDPFGMNKAGVISSTDGVVIGQTTLPLLHEGEAVCHIARFSDPEKTEASIEILRQDHDAEVESDGSGAPA